MKKYELLEHKADLKIKVFGKTKKQLFSHALFAMAENMRPETSTQIQKKEQTQKIKIKSFDPLTLLVDFLNEVLYLSQTNSEVYFGIKITKFFDSLPSGKAEIEGELIGQKVKRFGTDIKAVTYHGLDIYHKKSGFWEATMLFDI